MTTIGQHLMISDVLVSAEQMREYGAGEALFRDGDPTLGVYIIHSGEVELSVASHDGTPRALRRARSGEILSLSQVLTGRDHDATAVVSKRARIGFVRKEDFLSLVSRNREAWGSVLQLLSQQIHSMYLSMKGPGRGFMA